MSIHSARSFVARLREDQDFRNKTLATSSTEDLLALLQSEDMAFDQRELVEAMTECMQQQELQNGIGTHLPGTAGSNVP